MDKRVKQIYEAADYIRERIGDWKPEIGLVLGSGLGKVAAAVEAETTIPYAKIPHFVPPTAPGHAGNFIFGTCSGKPVCVMLGRYHYYEGLTMEQVTFPIRVMAALGVQILLVSNASGGLNRNYTMGDLMIIRDHISRMPNPLIGPNMDAFGERFIDMTVAYDPALIQLAEHIADREAIKVQKGVYVANPGPSFETPAESRFYLTIGADAVGMSTVPEVIVARHCGMRVFGISVISNLSNLENENPVSNVGDEVLQAADAAADRMRILFTHLIAAI
jgi:purine-nucleoside phosphorylase